MRSFLGIEYTSHNGIQLGGSGTAYISGQTTEAQMCWTCHDAQSTAISEWSTNTDTNTGSYSNYNFGTLSTSNWYTATWTSPTQTSEVTSGTVQIDTNGILHIDNDI